MNLNPSYCRSIGDTQCVDAPRPALAYATALRINCNSAPTIVIPEFSFRVSGMKISGIQGYPTTSHTHPRITAPVDVIELKKPIPLMRIQRHEKQIRPKAAGSPRPGGISAAQHRSAAENAPRSAPASAASGGVVHPDARRQERRKRITRQDEN